MFVQVEDIRLHDELAQAPSFDGFWTKEKCRLLAEAQSKFGPLQQELLKSRRAFKQAMDTNAITLGFPKDDSIRRANWTVDKIDDLYLKPGPELVSPLRDPHMAINAAKAHGEQHKNGLASTIFDNCDAGHYANTIDGLRDLSKILSGYYSTHYNNRDYRYNEKEDGLGVWWLRVNGLGAAPIDSKKLTQNNGEAISRTIFEIVFYASHAIDCMKAAIAAGEHEKAILLAPKIYIPKLEFAAEAQWVDQLCEFIEKEKGVASGTIKIGLVVETPTLVYELDETCHALSRRLVKASFGRYDALAAAIAINSENPDKEPPGPLSMNIKTAPAKDQFAHMLRVLHKRGVYAIGGMDVPVGQTEAVFAAVQANKTWEGEYVDSAWISAPAHTLAAATGLAAGRKIRESSPNALTYILSEQIEESVLAEKLNSIPVGVVTEAELNGLIRKFIEFAEGYLRGIGCCAYFDSNSQHNWSTMEDFATAGEYPIKAIYTWLKQGTMIHIDKYYVVHLTKAIVEEKVAHILSSIEEGYNQNRVSAKGEKMSVENYNQGYYPQAALLFLAAVTQKECVTFAKDDLCWPAYLYLQSLNLPQQQKSYSDNKPWAARLLDDAQVKPPYPWYRVTSRQESLPLDEVFSVNSTADLNPKTEPGGPTKSMF